MDTVSYPLDILFMRGFMETIEEYLMDPGCHPPFEIDIYLNGDCDLFAAAVHRLTGWQIGVIVEPRLITTPHVSMVTPHNGEKPLNKVEPTQISAGLVHAFCVNNTKLDQIFDAKGWRDANSLNKEYRLHDKCSVQFMSEEELFSLVQPIQTLNECRLMETIAFVQKYYKHFL